MVFQFETGIFDDDIKFLETLADVNISNPTDGQAVVYNATTKKYENGDVVSGSVAGSFGDVIISTGADTVVSNNKLNVSATGAVGFNGQYGSTGEVLTSQGTGASPIWAAPSGGGGSPVYASLITNGTQVLSGSMVNTIYDIRANYSNGLYPASLFVPSEKQESTPGMIQDADGQIFGITIPETGVYLIHCSLLLAARTNANLGGGAYLAIKASNYGNVRIYTDDIAMASGTDTATQRTMKITRTYYATTNEFISFQHYLRLTNIGIFSLNFGVQKID